MSYTFALFTNTYNPHMEPLAKALYDHLGDNFVFIAYERLDEERKQLGWSEHNDQYVKYYFEEPAVCQKIINTVGTLYYGANPHMFHCVKERINNGLLTYFHMERILKHGILQFFWPQYTKYYIEQRIRPSKLENVYFLACSAYLKNDLKKLHACTERTVRFGYFPIFIDSDCKAILSKRQKSNKIKLLCGGRMIEVKHIDHIILAYAKAIKSLPENLTSLEIMGTGKLENKLRKLTYKLGLKNQVSFIGSLPPEKVREKMIESDIFIAASDKREGWGAVINEAMNSCCAVIASKEMGSVPFLINEENGYRFNSGNVHELSMLINRCILNREERIQISQNAFETIRNLWNPEIAAQRLISYSESFHNESEQYYENGPMSK